MIRGFGDCGSEGGMDGKDAEIGEKTGVEAEGSDEGTASMVL